MGDGWGSVLPNWITAATAVAALVAAVVAARAAWQQLRIEQLREEQRRADEVAWQANRVAAWIDTDQAGETVVAVVANASTLPVYDLQVNIVTGKGEVGKMTGNITPPGSDVQLEWAGKTFTSWAEFTGGGVIIEFSDAAGKRWRRDMRGKLTGL